MTTFYDSAGHIKYEQYTLKESVYQAYIFNYDARGHALTKEGFSTEDGGSKTIDVYEGDKLVQEMKINAGFTKTIRY